MHSITEILNIILKSIFVGFGVIIPILSLIKTSGLKSIEVKDLFILTAVQLVRVSGIIYFILAITGNLGAFSAKNATGEGLGLEYFLYLFFSPLMYLLLTQLFWIKKLYMKKMARITLSILMLILPSSWFLLLVKTENIGTVTKAVFTTEVISVFFLNIIVFIFMTFTIILLGGKLKDKKV
ncbi:hypothetical protein D3C87_660280 [compost metagenome]